MDRYAMKNENDSWVVYDTETNSTVAAFTLQEDAQIKLDTLLNEQDQQVGSDLSNVNLNLDQDERLLRFNWAAFFGNGLWAFLHKQYLVLLIGIGLNPLIRYSIHNVTLKRVLFITVSLAISIYLGKNGYRMAWNAYKNQYITLEKMFKVQRTWCIIFLTISCFGIVLWSILGGLAVLSPQLLK